MTENPLHRLYAPFSGSGKGVSFTPLPAGLLLVFIMITGCITPLPKSGHTESAIYIKKLPISVMGVRRSYLVHLPPGHENAGPLPMMLVIHGAFSTAGEMERQSGFSRLADREKFIVVYPNGAFGILGFLQHWNAGHCCGKAAEDNIDDTGFLDSVIDDVAGRFRIDRRRVYMVGFSNGGMMTYRYAAERPHTVASIAVVAGSIGGKASNKSPVWVIPAPSRPVPLIAFHGREDWNVPFDGGISPARGGTREYFSVKQSVDFWRRHNKCEKAPAREILYGGMVSRQRWMDQDDKECVVLYSLEKWGHVWPGRFFTEALDADNEMKGIDAAEIIWQFLKDQARE